MRMVLIVHWLLSALSLLIVAHLVPGFEVRSFGTALLAAVVIGLVNATLGFILKVFTPPLTILTLGLFLIVINALMLCGGDAGARFYNPQLRRRAARHDRFERGELYFASSRV